MKNVVKSIRFCFLVVTLSCGAVSALGQTPPAFNPAIVGVVVDKEEVPVAGAKVCAWSTSGRPMQGRIPCEQSDSDGKFVVNVYRPDTYRISAQHEAQGYPDAIWGFYGKQFSDFPLVTVDDAGSQKPVRIKLGPKASRVIFTILDADTRKPIKKGSIKVCRVGETFSCWSISTAFPNGQYELLTPEVPFTVEFQTWETDAWVKRYAFYESGVAMEAVQVDLGARKEITVILK